MAKKKKESTWQTCVARAAKPYVRATVCAKCEHKSECTPMTRKTHDATIQKKE
jgi:hypothetical protein